MSSRRELAWILLMTAVMTAGVVGVLLLMTAMQRQSLTLVHEQQVVQDLQLHTQSLRTALAHDADPAVLSRRARGLKMHPATSFRWPDHGIGRGPATR